MATETAAVAVAQTGETQNPEVALTAAPDTEAYNTVIEMLKSRELELSVTQLGLLESVTRQMLDRNSALEKKCTHQLLNHTELSCTTVDCTCAVLLGPLRLPRATPLDLDCWSHRRLATSLLMMCGLAYSHPTRCSRV